MPETFVPLEQYHDYTYTLQLVRDLSEGRLRHDPQRKVIKAEPVKFATEQMLRRYARNTIDFDGKRMTNFISGKTCTARSVGGGNYVLDWGEGKTSRSTARDLQIAFCIA